MNNSTFGKVLGKGGKFYNEVSSPETFGNIENVKAIAVVDGKPATTTDYETFTPIVPDQLEQDVETLKTDVEELGNEQNQLASDLTNETTAREQADTTLQTNIDAETTAREQADTTLQNDINTRAKLDGSNLTDENVASWNTKLLNKPAIDITSFSGTLSELCEEIVNNYRTKRIFFNLSDIYENQQIANIIPKPIDYNKNNIPCEIRNVIHGAKNYYCCIEIIAFNGGSQNNQSSVCYLIKTSTAGLNETVTLTEWCLLDTKNNAINFAEEEWQKSKNLIEVKELSETGSGITYTNDNNTVILNGTATKGVQINIYKYFTLEKGKTYTFSCRLNGQLNPATDTERFLLFITFKGVSGSVYRDFINHWIGKNEFAKGIVTHKVTPSEDMYYTGGGIYWPVSFVGSSFVDAELSIQLEEGSVATDYKPYNGAIVHEKDIEPDSFTFKSASFGDSVDGEFVLVDTNIMLKGGKYLLNMTAPLAKVNTQTFDLKYNIGGLEDNVASADYTITGYIRLSGNVVLELPKGSTSIKIFLKTYSSNIISVKRYNEAATYTLVRI